MIAVVLGGALWAGPAASAEYRLEHIPLRHCRPEELLPLLRPIVEGHGMITGGGTADRPVLLVRSSPPRLTQVRDVVLALDMPPRPLRMSVRQGTAHAIRAFEGFDTWIVIRREPRPEEREAAPLSDGVAVADDWWAEAIGTGFYVTPWVQGGRVRLQLRTTRTMGNGGQDRGTTLAGRVGEWIEVGGVLEEHASGHLGLRFEPDRDPRLESSVQVRVETLD